MLLLFNKETKLLEFASKEAKAFLSELDWSVKSFSDLCSYLSSSTSNDDIKGLESGEFDKLNFKFTCDSAKDNKSYILNATSATVTGTKYISVSIYKSNFQNPYDSKRFNCAKCSRISESTKLLDLSNAKFKAIFDNAVDAIIIINEKGFIQSYNRAAEKIFGYTKSEAINQNISLLMPEPYKSEHDSYLLRYVKTGKSNIIHLNREVIAKRKNGDVFPIDLSVSEATYDGNTLFTGFIRDISIRKKTERELETFFYMTHDLFCISDFKGKLAKFNQNWKKILGYSDKELNGLDIESIFHPSDISQTKPAFKGMLGGTNVNGRSVRLKCKNGSYRWFTWNCSTDLEHKQIYATATDITDQKNLVMNLNNARNKAINDTEVIAKMFESIKEDLEAAGKMQMDLLPSNELKIDGIDFYLYYDPCEHIGGDILDIVVLNDDVTAFYIIDVSGHGIKSALLAVGAHHLLSSWAGERNLLVSKDGTPKSPEFVASELNTEFIRETTDFQYFTMIYGLVNKKEKKLTYVRAGHTMPIIHKSDGNLLVPDAGSKPIGLCDNATFKQYEMSFNKGDRLILYSDGITEAREVGKSEFYGEERLLMSVEKTKKMKLDEAVGSITKDLKKGLSNSKPTDDVALMIIELK